MSWRETLFGRPLRTEEEQVEQIGVWSGVPVLGLDALASSSYGPEAALTILLPLGTLAAADILPISFAIVGVLAAVFISYRQTIAAYPQGGGSFTVAKENLGSFAGLLAASALSIDYILNVAVAISAGVGALVSVCPALLPYTLPLCLGILGLLAIVNLRGIRTAGLVFMLPTYLFVAGMVVTLAVGAIRTWMSGGHPLPIVPMPHAAVAATKASVWLWLRAFASGCAALTGVEAVSNAVPVFRPPSTVLARRTLTVIIALLIVLLLGIAYLCRTYHITATAPGEPGFQSVISQLMSATLGRGALYYGGMTATLMVLALSANTSFADFPRVCRVLALDQYLPAEFAHRGSRLVYSTGIVVLTLLSGALLIAYRGITDRLIPLFAVGAFLAFTLSQIGMVAHWLRRDEPGAKRSLVLNAFGAAATATTLIVIVVSKFREGAWLVIVAIPPLLLLFRAIHRYHTRLDRQIVDSGPLRVRQRAEPLILIPLNRLDRVSRKALRIALGLSGEIRAVQILAEQMRTEDLSARWEELVRAPAREAGYRAPELVVVYSAYREFYGPLLDYVRKVTMQEKERPVALVLPELVERRWYQFLVRHRATVLKGLLLLNGSPRLIVITVPWYSWDAD